MHSQSNIINVMQLLRIHYTVSQIDHEHPYIPSGTHDHWNRVGGLYLLCMISYPQNSWNRHRRLYLHGASHNVDVESQPVALV